jgi:predicted anti-sigma-YlaC factor YlaD
MALSPMLPEVCNRTRQQVSLRLDSELSELEEALLAVHLARCGACAAFASEIETFTQALRAAPLEEASRLVTLPRRPSRLGRAYVGSAAAAAIAAVVAVGGLVGTHSSPNRFTKVDVESSRAIISQKEQQLEALDGDATRPVAQIQLGLEAAEQTTLDSDRSTR